MNEKEIDKKKIQSLLPHREPMLLIDKLTNIVHLKSATAIMYVKKDGFYVQGHFPDQPVMPGVLIVEAMAQTAACLMSYSNKSLQKKKAVFLTSIENTKFKKMTTSGDILKLKVKVISNRKNFYKFSATAHVEDALVASSDFSAMLQS